MVAPDRLVGPAMPDLQALQTELGGLMTSVRKFQVQLRQVTLAADERTKQLEAKVEELEAQNLSQCLEIRELERENRQMHEMLEARNPWIAQLTQERNKTAKELKHAQAVIADLLGRLKGAGANTKYVAIEDNPIGGPSLPTQHPKRETLVESDDESTIRPPRSVASVAIQPAGSASTNRSTVPTGGGVENPVSRTSSKETDSASGSAVSAKAKEDSSARGPSSPSKKRISWYLEFAKPPATAEVQRGPIPFDLLAEKLVLDEDTADQILNLEFMGGYDTCIHPEADMVFVYRPVVLEGPSHSYLIGWGDESMVRNVQAWTQDSPALNIFCFPSIENSGWYYLGLHTLSYAPIKSVWGKLSREDQEKLLSELADRNPDMDRSQFRRDVREGKLIQCCIQLESKGKAESLEYLRTYGL
ncbi:hypothetical protein C8Q76DRAFT_721462 [Earliella scabrosa]|nr:hypothetical protein C8Q76DRAFT_721462 [Earliella scabrosa]